MIVHIMWPIFFATPAAGMVNVDEGKNHNNSKNSNIRMTDLPKRDAIRKITKISIGGSVVCFALVI